MSTDVLYRSYGSDLELRKGGDGRTIYGIAVPYRKAVRINDNLVEQFAPAPFPDQVRAFHRIAFAREHVMLGGSILGPTRLLRDDTAGLYGEWRISKTPLGDETIELFRDGVYRDFSIGFRERVNRTLPDGTIERVRAVLFEVALTREGAYGDLAMAQGIRSAAPGAAPELERPNLAEARKFLLPPLAS